MLNILLNDQALQCLVELTLSHLSPSQFSLMVMFVCLFVFLFFFQKCNPPDFKLFLGKLNNKHFPHMVQCQFCFWFQCIKQYKEAKKI